MSFCDSDLDSADLDKIQNECYTALEFRQPNFSG